MRRGTNLPLMGEFNQAVVLELIRRSGDGLTRADLARSTGLSAQTVTNVVRRLMDRALVLEGPTTRAGLGRPGTLLRLDPVAGFAVGVHLDPAAISLVLLDLSGSVLVHRWAEPPRSEEPSVMLGALVTAIDALIAEAGVERDRVLGVGIATPGPIDAARGIVVDPPHLRAWHDVPVRDHVAAQTGLPALLDKDVIAAASAHLWHTREAKPENSLFCYLGTGIALATIVDGEVVRGASGNAGEAGHIVVDCAGPPCECGQRGCLGTVLSASGLVSEARRAGVRLPEPSARPVSEGRAADLDAVALCRLAEEGDAPALGVLATAGRRLATGAGTVSNLLDLDAVILGGPLWARIEPWAGPAARTAMAHHRVPGGRHGLTVESSDLGASVGAVGAACLMLDEFFTPHPTDLLLRSGAR